MSAPLCCSRSASAASRSRISFLLARELCLALDQRLFAALDRARRNSTAPSSWRRAARLFLDVGDLRFALGQPGGELAQLGVPLVELGRAAPEHLLDARPQLVRPHLAALEVGDRLRQLPGARFDLVALLGEDVLDLLVVGVG